MRRQVLYVVLLAVSVLAVAVPSSLGASSNGNARYIFNGRLLADAGSSPSIFVDVNGGNRAALKKLIGEGDNQQFAVDGNTEFIRWTHGVPTVVPESNLVAGDRVSVRVHAAREATLAQIESTPARIVADRGPNARFPRKPLWLFVGTLDAPAANGHLTLRIKNGNLRSLRAMLGQPLDQTFSYDNHTIFVRWTGSVPTVISSGQLAVGDRVSVRIRAPRSYSLGQVEQVPANHIAAHEPGA